MAPEGGLHCSIAAMLAGMARSYKHAPTGTLLQVYRASFNAILRPERTNGIILKSGIETFEADAT